MLSAMRTWLFRRRKAAAPVDLTGAIHIHEDDWGMRNLYPLAAQPEALADLQDATVAGEKNRDPSGLGWTDVHVIKPPSTTYAAAGLLLSEAAAAVEPIMPRVQRFYAGTFASIGSKERDPLGSYEEDAWCFGFDEGCYLKLEPASDHVERIWFDLWRVPRGQKAALRRAIEAIDRLVPSMIVDYRLDMAVPVGDAGQLDRYFARFEPGEQPAR
jgi:hypothetical protein